MIQEVNQGDQTALRDFLGIYAKHILDRATAQTPDEQHAREATRMTILAITTAAKAGRVPSEPVPWVDKLTDESVARLSMPLTPAQPAQPIQPIQPPTPPAPMAPPVETAWEPAVPMHVEPALDAYAYAPAAPEPAAEPFYAPPAPEQPPVYAPARAAQKHAARQVPDLFDADADAYAPEEEARPPRRRKKNRDDAPVGLVFLIFLMVLVVLGLVWMLLVMLMSKGYLPVMDFGFAQWFNANVFVLF
ncbi:MAG: hypothetical protein Q4E65_09625 [Clostridia bacterium]|nr:hypothetical protein [Clostridia bacterium]